MFLRVYTATFCDPTSSANISVEDPNRDKPLTGLSFLFFVERSRGTKPLESRDWNRDYATTAACSRSLDYKRKSWKPWLTTGQSKDTCFSLQRMSSSAN